MNILDITVSEMELAGFKEGYKYLMDDREHFLEIFSRIRTSNTNTFAAEREFIHYLQGGDIEFDGPYPPDSTLDDYENALLDKGVDLETSERYNLLLRVYDNGFGRACEKFLVDET